MYLLRYRRDRRLGDDYPGDLYEASEARETEDTIIEFAVTRYRIKHLRRIRILMLPINATSTRLQRDFILRLQ